MLNFLGASLSVPRNYHNDALRRLIVKGQQDGSTIHNYFDLAGRMVERKYGQPGTWNGTGAPPETPTNLESTDTFTYDAASRIITTDKGRYDVQTAHSYADDGKPLTESYTIENHTYTFTRTYDAANRVLTHTFADGKVMEWVYDNRNVVIEVKYDGEQVLTQNHDAAYRLANQTFGNSLTRTITYGRQDNLRTNDKVGTIAELNFDYTYAADKNVLTENSPNGALQDLSFTATYDAGNRVASWTRDDQYLTARETQTWNYDNAGNWDKTTIDGNVENRTNNASDEATQIDGNALTYGSRGNLTEDEADQEYIWDLDNRIKQIDPSLGGGAIKYCYDAFSRRVYRRQGSTREVLLWWGKEEYSEHKDQASTPTIQNDLHAHPTGLNTTFGRALEGDKNDIQYFHKNYLDHVYAVSDDNGNIIEQYRYSAFGEVEIYNSLGLLIPVTLIDNDIMWNVKRYDGGSGLYMYLYRHYDPSHGRWPSRDPIGEDGGVNLYGVVRNRVLNQSELLGLEDEKPKEKKNVKRKVIAIFGPNIGAEFPASNPVFSKLVEEYFLDPKTTKMVRARSNSGMITETIGIDNGKGGNAMTQALARLKKQWEQKNQKICCVDFDGKIGSAFKGDSVQRMLSSEYAKDADKIYLVAHNVDGKLLMGLGQAKHPKSGRLTYWATGRTPREIFYWVQNNLNVDIFTCFGEDIPEESITDTPHGNIGIKVVQKKGPAWFMQFKGAHLKPWVDNECKNNNKPL